MRSRRPFIAAYIMASGRNGTLYVGATSNLVSRVGKHRDGIFDGFSKRHGCTRLVWVERHAWMTGAIRREKRLKHWLRDWKLKLIEDANPEWADLAAEWFRGPDPDWAPPEEPD
jgi:putative endonuclease